MRDPIRSDLGPVLERAVEEMGLRLPSRDEAVWTLLRYYVSELASGNARGKEGLQPIIDVYYGAALYEATEKYVGDSHGIDSLIGAYYSYEDVSKGSDAESTLEAEVIQQAKAWMGKHCA
jgi:hypothetical protein